MTGIRTRLTSWGFPRRRRNSVAPKHIDVVRSHRSGVRLAKRCASASRLPGCAVEMRSSQKTGRHGLLVVAPADARDAEGDPQQRCDFPLLHGMLLVQTHDTLTVCVERIVGRPAVVRPGKARCITQSGAREMPGGPLTTDTWAMMKLLARFDGVQRRSSVQPTAFPAPAHRRVANNGQIQLNSLLCEDAVRLHSHSAA